MSKILQLGSDNSSWTNIKILCGCGYTLFGGKPEAILQCRMILLLLAA
jgi:hypothetical protein